MSLVYHEETVSEVKVKYFDTLPPCSSICVLKTGFLFAASEFGNHSLYQFSVSACLLAPLFVMIGPSYESRNFAACLCTIRTARRSIYHTPRSSASCTTLLQSVHM